MGEGREGLINFLPLKRGRLIGGGVGGSLIEDLR